MCQWTQKTADNGQWTCMLTSKSRSQSIDQIDGKYQLDHKQISFRESTPMKANKRVIFVLHFVH